MWICTLACLSGCNLVCVPLCLWPDGCGSVQTVEPVTVTNLTNTDTRGGSDTGSIRWTQPQRDQPLTEREREQDINRTRRESLWHWQKDQRFVRMCLPPSGPPAFTPQYQAAWEWCRWIHRQGRAHTYMKETIHKAWHARQTSDTGAHPPNPSSPSLSPIPSPYWPDHPPHPASFVSHKSSSLKAGWLHTALQWGEDRAALVATLVVLQEYILD